MNWTKGYLPLALVLIIGILVIGGLRYYVMQSQPSGAYQTTTTSLPTAVNGSTISTEKFNNTRVGYRFELPEQWYGYEDQAYATLNWDNQITKAKEYNQIGIKATGLSMAYLTTDPSLTRCFDGPFRIDDCIGKAIKKDGAFIEVSVSYNSVSTLSEANADKAISSQGRQLSQASVADQKTFSGGWTSCPEGSDKSCVIEKNILFSPSPFIVYEIQAVVYSDSSAAQITSEKKDSLQQQMDTILASMKLN